MSREAIEEETTLRCLEYWAIGIITNRIYTAEIRELNDTLKSHTYASDTLSEICSSCDEQARRISHKYGFQGSFETIRHLIAEPPGETFYLRKTALQSLFLHHEKFVSGLDEVPPHAMIVIPIYSLGKEIFILEARLFEDMAMLWNKLCDSKVSKENSAGHHQRVVSLKEFKALLGSTAKAAFNVLEAYVNGIATDVLATRSHGSLTQKEMERLTEENVLLSLEDKLKKYPRIALNRIDPPLQESNCPEMKYILEEEKRLRHALIHPTPRDPTPHGHGPTVPTREEIIVQLSYEEIEKLCDNTIALISSIDSHVGSQFPGVNHWLYRRCEDGRFPQEAFL